MKLKKDVTISGATKIRNRFALLIGVRDYIGPAYNGSPLPHTVHDVNELEKVLTGCGYIALTLHSDKPGGYKPTRENIWGEMKNLSRQTGPGDLLLVHFGGHGDLDDKRRAYLVPANGRKSALEYSAVNLEKFKQEFADSRAQAKILILDACHSGIGRDAAGMAAEFERRVYLEAEGTATLASCRHSEVAYEHDESPHGAFTYYLLEGLKGAAKSKNQNFITFDDLKNYVTNSVKEWAVQKGLQQWPNAATQLVGDPPIIELPRRQEGDQLSPILPPNPFTDILAIRDMDRFVGRGMEQRRLTAMLEGGSVSLLGDEPKIGKSSLMRYLAHNWDGDVIGPLDCNILIDREDFFMQIVEGLNLDNCDWRTIRGALQNRRVLLLLDELDVAPDHGLTHDDLARFRAVSSSNPGFKMVTASRLFLKDIFPDPGRGSPAYSFLQPFTLGPLPEEEALNLLSHPWAPDAPTFDEVTCNELLTLSGCHPFKIQRAAFHRYEALADPSYDWRAAFHRDVEHMLGTY